MYANDIRQVHIFASRCSIFQLMLLFMPWWQPSQNINHLHAIYSFWGRWYKKSWLISYACLFCNVFAFCADFCIKDVRMYITNERFYRYHNNDRSNFQRCDSLSRSVNYPTLMTVSFTTELCFILPTPWVIHVKGKSQYARKYICIYTNTRTNTIESMHWNTLYTHEYEI